MKDIHRNQGFGSKEALLGLIVIIIFAAILFPIARRSANKDLLLSEAARMRNIYKALYLYEERYDSMPAPSLTAAVTFDPNKSDYLSDEDPFASSQPGPFPADPGLVTGEVSPFRISFSYIQSFVRTNKIQIKPWLQTREDTNIGELADEWLGSVRPGQNFQAQVSGKVLRICTDGHVYLVADRGGPKPLGDAQDLFLRK